MTETPKMSFLAALQAKKESNNESQATTPKTESTAQSQSRPNPLLSALGKTAQKAESPLVVGDKPKTSIIPSKDSSSVASSPVASVGAVTPPQGNEIGKAIQSNLPGTAVVGDAGGGVAQGATAGNVSGGSKAGETGTPAVTSFASRLAAAQKAASEAPEKANYDHLFDSIPENFQEVLDKFDALLIRDNGVTELNVMHLRDYVKRIFIDLRENPEYDGLIIDRDVHNVLRFMRSVKGQAQELAVEKKEKKAKADAGKAKRNKFAAIASQFDPGGLSLTSLEDLSNFGAGEMEDL